jgi:hypothetical protein
LNSLGGDPPLLGRAGQGFFVAGSESCNLDSQVALGRFASRGKRHLLLSEPSRFLLESLNLLVQRGCLQFHSFRFGAVLVCRGGGECVFLVEKLDLLSKSLILLLHFMSSGAVLLRTESSLLFFIQLGVQALNLGIIAFSLDTLGSALIRDYRDFFQSAFVLFLHPCQGRQAGLQFKAELVRTFCRLLKRPVLLAQMGHLGSSALCHHEVGYARFARAQPRVGRPGRLGIILVFDKEGLIAVLAGDGAARVLGPHTKHGSTVWAAESEVPDHGATSKDMKKGNSMPRPPLALFQFIREGRLCR